MLITRFCSECGAKVQFDDSKRDFYCSSCGAKNVIEVNSNVDDSSLSFKNIQVQIDLYNLVISYKTSNNVVKMYVTIPVIGKKYEFIDGDHVELKLPNGNHTITFKIGNITYLRTVIVQDGVVLHISSSWDGRAHIDADIPNRVFEGRVVNNSTQTVVVKKRGVSGGAVAGIVLGLIALFMIIIILLSVGSYLSKVKRMSESTATTETAESGKNSEDKAADNNAGKEKFIQSCEEIDYKAIARNPSDYIGKNYKYTCYVYSVREAGALFASQKYYVTYALDLDKAQDRIDEGSAENLEEAESYARDYDTSIWLLDNRNESDPDYVKILEGDIVTVYGTFNGMTETKNTLTNEKGEQVALDIKYVVLLDGKSTNVMDDSGEGNKETDTIVGDKTSFTDMHLGDIGKDKNIYVGLQYVKTGKSIPKNWGKKDVEKGNKVLFAYFEFYNGTDRPIRVDLSEIACYVDGVQVLSDTKSVYWLSREDGDRDDNVDGICQYADEYLDGNCKLISAEDFQIPNEWKEIKFFYGDKCSWTITPEDVSKDKYDKKSLFDKEVSESLTNEDDIVVNAPDFEVQFKGLKTYKTNKKDKCTNYIFKFHITNKSDTTIKISSWDMWMRCYQDGIYLGAPDTIDKKFDGFVNICKVENIAPGMSSDVFVDFRSYDNHGKLFMIFGTDVPTEDESYGKVFTEQ